MNIPRLPLALMSHIFSYSSNKELISFLSLCKTAENFIFHPICWKHRFGRDGFGWRLLSDSKLGREGKLDHLLSSVRELTFCFSNECKSKLKLMKNLTRLKITPFYACDISWLSCADKLLDLEIETNQSLVVLLFKNFQFPSLTNLYIRSVTPISHSDIVLIQKVTPRLTQLEFSCQCDFNLETLNVLDRMTELKSLTFGGTPYLMQSGNYTHNIFKKLKRVGFSGNYDCIDTQKLFECFYFVNFQCLRELRLWGFNLNSELLKKLPISGLPNIVSLRLTPADTNDWSMDGELAIFKMLTEEGMMSILHCFINLEIFVLDRFIPEYWSKQVVARYLESRNLDFKISLSTTNSTSKKHAKHWLGHLAHQFKVLQCIPLSKKESPMVSLKIIR